MDSPGVWRHAGWIEASDGLAYPKKELLSEAVLPGRVQFSELPLIEPLLRALANAGYTTPTPIQQAAMPPALEGRDVLGCAQTGTGKTAAFALPMLQRIDKAAAHEPSLRGLILAPTRELAAQIGDGLEKYGKELDLYHTVIFGGVNEKPQIRELERGVDILVATPGRLLDLMQRRFVDLSKVEIFVLDEADRMLDMGFIHDVRRVVAALPKKKQTLFFSATMPGEVRKLSESLLQNPVQVSVTPVSSTADKIEQSVYFVDKSNKPRLLLHLLSNPDCQRVLVFSRTKHGANRIAETLTKARIGAAAIHGNKSQGARTRALEGFKSGEIKLLVATDIAARGIDVDGVTHVINFDIPNIAETYVHRIGRTARAGREGVAFSLCDAEERGDFRAIEKLIGKEVTRVSDHPFPPGQGTSREDASMERPPLERQPRHSRGGRGPDRPSASGRQQQRPPGGSGREAQRSAQPGGRQAGRPSGAGARPGSPGNHAPRGPRPSSARVQGSR
jgi:ATP-dependent RNA helicase RhlE